MSDEPDRLTKLMRDLCAKHPEALALTERDLGTRWVEGSPGRKPWEQVPPAGERDEVVRALRTIRLFLELHEQASHLLLTAQRATRGHGDPMTQRALKDARGALGSLALLEHYHGLDRAEKG